MKRRIACTLMSAVMATALVPGVALMAPQTAQAAIDEQEPNDDLNHATQISMGTAVYGTSDDGEDDYFKVNLPVSGKVKVTLTNDRYADTSRHFYVYVYNKYYEEVGYGPEAYLSTTRPQSRIHSLNKGTNYIRITYPSSYFAGHPYHFKLTYVVPGTTISSVAGKTSAVSVKWVKKSGAASYKIRYSTKKNMSGAKTVDASKKSSSKTIKGLKRGKTYFVQVRVAKKIGGKTYYSSWSSKKAVKTK